MNDYMIVRTRVRIIALAKIVIPSIIYFTPIFVQGASPVSFLNWRLVHPHISGEWLAAAVWGEPGCVVVGHSGEILFSKNGGTWLRVDSPLQQDIATRSVNLRDVCFGNGVYIAVGGTFNQGFILRSMDGQCWDIIDTAVTKDFRGVTFGDGTFVAVAGKTVLSSTNGEFWQRRADSPGLRKLVYGGGKWVGISGEGRYHYTTDLMEWSTSESRSQLPVFIGSSDWKQSGICYGGGNFVAVGGHFTNGLYTSSSVIQYSADGITWSFGESDDGETIWGVQQDCAYSNGTFVTVGASATIGYQPRDTYFSSDGKIWSGRRNITPANLHTVDGYLTAIAASDGRPFIAVSSAGEIWQSFDGKSWQVVSATPRDYIEKVEYANGSYVAVGGRTDFIRSGGSAAIFSSVDGLHWISYLPNRIDKLSDIAYGESLWVSTGNDGGIFTSPDTINWTDRSWPETLNDLDTVVYGNEKFIAFSVRRDRIYHSDDGLSWQIMDGPPVAGVKEAAFINDEFLAVGEKGLILSSKDGLAWDDYSINTTATFVTISYGNNRYVLGGYDHIATSIDRVKWELHEFKLAPRDITYSTGRFIASDLRYSNDGVNWKIANNTFRKYSRMYSISVVDKTFVGVLGFEIWRCEIDFGVPDEIPPEITVSPPAVVLNLGAVPPNLLKGVSAVDNLDGDLSTLVVTGGEMVDVNAPGKYAVTYNVSDCAENIAEQKTRTYTLVTEDRDNDGMPDLWEDQFGDLTPDDDDDDDDIPNIVEFQKDLNPIAPNNELQILILYRGWNLVTIPPIDRLESMTVSDFFDGKSKGAVWEWNSRYNRFEEVSNERISNGRGYWVFSTSTWSIDLQ